MNESLIKKGFMLGGVVNIAGILLVSQGLQSATLPAADPTAFSVFGMLVIMLWGAAYIAAAPYATRSVALPLVFAVEKLLYTVHWGCWISQHADSIRPVMENDMLGGLFLGAYGVNDGLFCLFFAYVAWRNWKKA